MAFRPYPADAWLALFERTMHKLWELEPGDVRTGRGTSFEVPLLSVICEYRRRKTRKVCRLDPFNSERTPAAFHSSQ